MKSFTWSGVLAAGTLGALVLGACDAETGPEPEPEDVAQQGEELLGGARFQSSCSASDRQLFEDAFDWGRPAAVSTAFTECVNQKMPNYYPCNDPWQSSSLAVQTQKILDAARSDNDLRIGCPSSGGDAWAWYISYGHSQEELMEFYALLNWARTRAQTDPVDAYAGLAGTAWHEAMHTHGYKHGTSNGGDPAADRAECGVPANWNPWEVVPYIVGSCIADTIRRSQTNCGANTCGETGKLLVTHYNGQSCACVDDPWLDATLWSPRYSDASGATTVEKLSVQYVDINLDGQADLCGLEGGAVRCSGSATVGFDAAAQGSWDVSSTGWSVAFADYRDTLAFPDINGDGNADVCMRQSGGIYCALTSVNCSTGVCIPSFGARNRWTDNYSDAHGWYTSASYWETIQYADVDGDTRDDVCGRGTAGVYCSLSTGAAFSQAILMASSYSNANGWNGHESYWRTIRIVDVSGDGKADVCGRGSGGILCGHYRPLFRDFGTVRLRTSAFSDPWWRDPQYYQTLEFGDLNGDGAADVCGRGDAGAYCGLYGGATEAQSVFSGTGSVAVTELSNANGWDAAARYVTLRLTDVDGDGKADLCGRGQNGIVCARSTAVLLVGFAAPVLWVKNFGDNFGWNASATHYATVKPARVSRAHPNGTAFCGRGWAGIYCSRR